VVVDRIRPTSAILDPTDGAILRGQAYVVGGTAADPDGRVQQVEVSADGGTLRRAQGGAWGEAQGQGAWNWTWELPADGDYTLRSRATDQAGWQEDPVTSLVNVAVDNTAPSTSMQLTHPGGEIHDGDTVRLEPTGSTWVITATGQVSDDTPAPRVSGVDTVSIQRDGRDQAVEMPPPAPGQRIADWQAVMRLPSGRPEGEHQLTTWAADQVRNVESPATLTFRVDTTPPTVGNLGSEPVLTPVSRQDLLHVTADDFGRYQPLPAHQPMRGNVDARSGRVGYRALNPADLDDGRLASGDFNGDDIPDLAVSAPGYQNNVGAVYLIFGKVGPWSSGHNLSEADAWLVGPVAGTRLGQSLANAGDLNGDGADELIIGAADGAYVSFGRDAGWRRGEVLDASDRLFPGRATLVSGGGDLDGDGDDDAVVAVGDTVYLVPGGSGRPLLGAPLGQLPGTVDSLAGHAGAGVMAGSSDGNEAWLWIPVSVPSTLPRSPSAIIRAARGSKTPSSVGYAGDVNGDGLPDWLIGDGRVGTARVARLFAGRAWTGGVYDDVTDATAGFKFGTAGEPALLATGIGDVNADGYDDIVVGFGTTAWVMHGRSDPETWGLEYDLGAADATISHLKSAAGAGLNCDGSAEVTLLTDDGRISLFFGKAGNSCAVTPAGVEQVEFGLGAVTDPSAPLTATLPARWTSASPVGSSWQTLADVPEPVGGTGPRPSGGGNIAAWDGRIWAIVGNDTRSFYAYDPQTDTWTRKADLPEDVDESSSLAAGGDGYLYATGNDHAAPVGGGFYRYDPAADRWTRLADPPYYHFDGTALAGDGAGHVYMTCGGYRYFYRYDIGTDTWVARAHVPQPVGNSRALVWVNDALYLLPGYDSVYPEYDSRAFYRYDPALDAWTRLGNAPDRIGYGGSLAWNGGQYIYALRGRDTTDFYRYDLQTDTWAVLTSTPGAVYDGGDLAWLDGYLYAARGFYSQSFWRMPGTWHVTPPEDGVFRIYARATDAVGNVETDPARWAQSRWRTLPDVPEGVGDGGRLAVVGDRVYVATGNGRTGFYAFAPGPGTWQRLADTPRTIGLGSDLADAGDGRLYLLTPAKNFWRYDIATDAWTEMHTYPGGAGEATAVAGDGLGTLYVLNSNQSRAFYRYTPTSGWEQLADTPAAGRWGSALTVVRDPRRGVHIYALRGSDSADFWRYDPDLDAWDVLPDIPGSVGSGGALAWACTDPEHGEGECDGGDYIYAFRGQASRGFYRYRISEARWEILPDAPATVHE
ncbi:MAG: Ig-like domain-containing protein, partial [Anaerolineae bacterium]